MYKETCSHHLSDDGASDSDDERRKDAVGDRANIALLMCLYILQGIPLGLSGSIPYLLQDRHVSYKEQAVFSIANWPFSIKLLWAPVVDSVYCSSFGRRKSWLVPAQFLIGLIMLLMALNIDRLLGNDSVNIGVITVSFLLLNLLAATQDIAVDGWALTMLSRKNISWASTCNTVGQSTGYLFGNVVFLALQSPEFCNQYLRITSQGEGIVTLQGFLYFWGLIFCTSTTLLMLLKSELSTILPCSTGVVDAYRQLWLIICLRPVRSFTILLLTSEVGFAVAEALTNLKLIESGLPKEHLALMSLPLMPIEILLPLFITRQTSGPRPLDFYLCAFPYRLLLCVEFGLLVWLSTSLKSSDGSFPVLFYVLIIVSFGLQQVASNCMFVTLMAFFSRVSDPSIGGTYMTLLNTVSNLGVDWPLTVSLWFVEHLTLKGCRHRDGTCVHNTLSGHLWSWQKESLCGSHDSLCVILDGFYVELVVAFLFGVVWLRTRAKHMKQLQNISLVDWSPQT